MTSEVTRNAFSVHSVFIHSTSNWKIPTLPIAVLDARNRIAVNKTKSSPGACSLVQGACNLVEKAFWVYQGICFTDNEFSFKTFFSFSFSGKEFLVSEEPITNDFACYASLFINW